MVPKKPVILPKQDGFRKRNDRRPRKQFPRKRCLNCGRRYTPAKATQKFCRDRLIGKPDVCRREYYEYGSSYGRLKKGLENAIDYKYRELRKEIRIELRNLWGHVQEIRRLEDALELRFTNQLGPMLQRLDAMEGFTVPPLGSMPGYSTTTRKP